MDKHLKKCAEAGNSASFATCAAESYGLTATPEDKADALENMRFIVTALQDANDLPHLSELNLVPLPPSVRNYLLLALQSICNGEDPASALGLKTGHRARVWSANQSRLVAEMVWQLVFGGMSETAAAKRVERILGSKAMRQIKPYSAIQISSWKTVKAAYDAHKMELDRKNGITRRTIR
jgi:hypothetical protein